MIFAQCAVLLHRSSMYNYWNQIPCMLASRIVKALQEKQLFHGGEGHSVKLLSFFSSLLYKFFNFLFQGWAISCWCVLRCQCLHRASHSAWWGRCIPGRKNRQTPQTSTGGKYCKYFSLNADATALRIHTVWKCLKKSHFMRFCRQILHSTFWHENQFLSEKRKKKIYFDVKIYITHFWWFLNTVQHHHMVGQQPFWDQKLFFYVLEIKIARDFFEEFFLTPRISSWVENPIWQSDFFFSGRKLCMQKYACCCAMRRWICEISTVCVPRISYIHFPYRRNTNTVTIWYFTTSCITYTKTPTSSEV